MTRGRGRTRLSFVVALASLAGIVVGIGIDRTVMAQQAGIKRTVLMTTDEPGSTTHEAIMAIAEVPPGGTSGRHRHTGVELGYVLEGSPLLQRDGQADVTLKPGDFFKNDGVHNVTNRGTSNAKMLAFYLVQKGKPLADPVK